MSDVKSIPNLFLPIRIRTALRIMKQEAFSLRRFPPLPHALRLVLKKLIRQFIRPFDPPWDHRWPSWPPRDHAERTSGSLPLITILMPVYDTDPRWLKAAVDSVIAQSYPHWQLCIVDDGSPTDGPREFLSVLTDPRISVKFLDRRHGIAAASNEAAAMAQGEYIGFLDHDDILKPEALLLFAAAIQAYGPDILYSDEDRIDPDGYQVRPFFKPDYSPDLLLCQNYICHFTTVRRSLFEQVQGFREGFDGAQDYDLLLRLTEVGTQILHIPVVLYSWREHPASTAVRSDAKPMAQDAGMKCLDDHLKRSYGPDAYSEKTPFPFVYCPRFPTTLHPRIAVVIPTRDGLSCLTACVDSIRNRSTHAEYEILIVNNQSEEPQTLEWFEDIRRTDSRIRILNADYPFCWSRLNNQGIRASDADVFIFLNNDTAVITPDWMERLSEQALLPRAGAVGPLLLYEDGTIQHAGVIVGMGGWADHVFQGIRPVHTFSPYVSPLVRRNVLAVSGACMAVSRNTIHRIGEFDESFLVCGSDVEFCIRAHQNGLASIYDPAIRLYHLEARTRGKSPIPAIDFDRSREVYLPFLTGGGDPYFNINLSLEYTSPALRFTHDT